MAEPSTRESEVPKLEGLHAARSARNEANQTNREEEEQVKKTGTWPPSEAKCRAAVAEETACFIMRAIVGRKPIPSAARGLQEIAGVGQPRAHPAAQLVYHPRS